MTINTLFETDAITAKLKPIKFKQIKAVYETLTVREEILNHLKPGTRYTSPGQVYESFRFLMNETKEHFITLHLNGKNCLICIDVVSIGSLNQSIVHPRNVFQTALLSNAAALLLLHNHPTGDPSPSREDIEITRRLKEAGELIGVRILDHLVIGETYMSFTEGGLL